MYQRIESLIVFMFCIKDHKGSMGVFVASGHELSQSTEKSIHNQSL